MITDRLSAIGNKIREARIAKGMTLEQVADNIAKATGEPVHFTTIAKIEKSQRTISVDWILKLADALDIDPAEFMALKHRKTIVTLRTVPLLGKIPAGPWREAVQEPVQLVPVNDAVGANAFALEPDGDSMNKVVPPGSIIVVDPDQSELLDGKVYAIMNSSSEATFKRFRANPMRLEPVSDNPEHQPIPIGKEPFTVIGRVVWTMARL